MIEETHEQQAQTILLRMDDRRGHGSVQRWQHGHGYSELRTVHQADGQQSWNRARLLRMGSDRQTGRGGAVQPRDRAPAGPLRVAVDPAGRRTDERLRPDRTGARWPRMAVDPAVRHHGTHGHERSGSVGDHRARSQVVHSQQRTRAGVHVSGRSHWRDGVRPLDSVPHRGCRMGDGLDNSSHLRHERYRAAPVASSGSVTESFSASN